MKEAHFVSILAYPRLDSCCEAVSSLDKQLVIAFSINGQNATGFCKDLTDEFASWQINNPEQLHQKVLDLLSYARQKKLELEFSLSLLVGEKIIFATYSGEVVLKRNRQVRKILESTKEVKIIVGNFKDNDQIVLINKSAIEIETSILKLLEANFSLEKQISEMSLIQQEYKNLGESLAFLTYKIKIDEEEKKEKVDYKTAISKIWATTKIVSKKIAEIFQKILIFSKIIIFKLQKQSKKKIIISIVTLLAFCLILFSSLTIIDKKDKKITANIEAKITEIKNNTNNINQLIMEQPLLARETAQKNLTSLETLKNEKNNKDSLKLINIEIDKLQTLIAEISSSNSLDQLSIAFNLENFLGKKIEVKNGEIFVLENNGREILKIAADQSKEKIALQNNEQIKDFTISENKLFILSSGIKVLDLNKNDQDFSEIKKEGESDKDGEHLSSFGPYLYLSNKNKRNIYRYYYNNNKLSEPIGWLVDKQGINFESISDLMIDGDLWIGTKNGNLLKFSKGVPANFQIRGIDMMPNSSIILRSNETAGFIAILEKKNKRLLILTKDGQLIKEIKSNELVGVSSIAFSDDGKKVFAVSGSVIYEVEVLK